MSGSENWLTLVAMAWLASVVLFVVSLRRYLASRALLRAQAEPPTVQEPYIEIGAASQVLFGPAPTYPHDSEPGLSAPLDRRLPGVAIGDEATHEAIARDFQVAGEASPVASTPGSCPASVREAVRDRVSRDRASAQGLSELIRALYLDQSNFTFHTLAELDAQDRALAKALIEEWLDVPWAVEKWEELYHAVLEGSPARRLSEWTSLPLSAGPGA
jgi:hypothetical protein